MSRTIMIRALRSATERELKEMSKMTGREIFRSLNTIFSLFEDEIDEQRYKAVKSVLKPIRTKDGYILYVGMGEILACCSDSLLATMVKDKFPDYKPGMYYDISLLSGETLSGERGYFYRKEWKQEKLSFKFPPRKRGYHIFFFDDMG